MSLYFKFKTFYLKEEEEVGKPYAFICHLPSRKNCKNIYIHREYIYICIVGLLGKGVWLWQEMSYTPGWGLSGNRPGDSRPLGGGRPVKRSSL